MRSAAIFTASFTTYSQISVRQCVLTVNHPILLIRVIQCAFGSNFRLHVIFAIYRCLSFTRSAWDNLGAFVSDFLLYLVTNNLVNMPIWFKE